MQVWHLFILSLLPGVGNFLGGLVAEFWKPTPRFLNWALHSASGVMIAIVATELLPKALDTLSAWWISLSFGLGGLLYIGIESTVKAIQKKSHNDSIDSAKWMIYLAVAVDLTSDGLMLGSGSAFSLELAAVLAAGQVLADFPEGYAAIANFRNTDAGRGKRLLLSGSFFIYSPLAALIAFYLLKSAPEILKLNVLVFISGLLTVAAVEDMLSEAHEAVEDNRRSILAFIFGFVLFVLVSTGLETLVRSH